MRLPFAPPKYCLIFLAALMLHCKARASAQTTITAISASSTLPPSMNYTYSAYQAIDGKKETSWVEGAKGDGIGEWLTIKLNQPLQLSQFIIINGFGVQKYWATNNRVRELGVSAGGNEVKVTLQDSAAAQVVRLPQPLQGVEFKFRILSVYRGTRDRDTAIAEISLSQVVSEVQGIPEEKPQPRIVCDVHAGITALPVDLYESPGGRVIQTLPKLEEFDYYNVRVVAQKGNMVEIEGITSGSKKIHGTGWVYSSFVVTGMQDSSSIKFRDAPDFDARVSSRYPTGPGEGASVSVEKCQGGWIYADYKGHSGWISPKYICPALETNCIGAGER
ncbi:MAG: discoidin domain-containing protein [Turneriella sp.]